VLVGSLTGEFAAGGPLADQLGGDTERDGEGWPVEEDRILGHARRLTKRLFE